MESVPFSQMAAKALWEGVIVKLIPQKEWAK